jgi:hypothetical protein
LPASACVIIELVRPIRVGPVGAATNLRGHPKHIRAYSRKIRRQLEQEVHDLGRIVLRELVVLNHEVDGAAHLAGLEFVTLGLKHGYVFVGKKVTYVGHGLSRSGIKSVFTGVELLIPVHANWRSIIRNWLVLLRAGSFAIQRVVRKDFTEDVKRRTGGFPGRSQVFAVNDDFDLTVIGLGRL